MVAGPGARRVISGLLDTGSDETVFEDVLAAKLGIDLSQAAERQVGLAGRPDPLRCRYASVELRISDGRETYEWTATVGFVSAPLAYSLLGYAGCLEYFDVSFHGVAREALLVPNASFPGRQLP